jgi:chromate transporter
MSDADDVADRLPGARSGPARRALAAAFEVLTVATRLGLTSFGGPIAHLGYFRDEYVARREWLDEQTYGDLVALCQFLPGPASSQVGIAVGIFRAGLAGGLAAWLGFTLPSAVALVLFGLGIRGLDLSGVGWLHGLKVAAVAVVAQAVWGMARSLCPDRERATIAILAALAVSAWPTAGGQVLVIVLAGVVGWRLLPGSDGSSISLVRVPIGRPLGIGALAMFFTLLLGLPMLRYLVPSHALAVVDSFYRAGALVFGGGHVVLPLLQAEVVPPGWVSNEQFLAGYGAAQAVPGPLFTFAAYLGAVMQPKPNGWAGAALALIAIFLPSFLLVVGTLRSGMPSAHGPRSGRRCAGSTPRWSACSSLPSTIRSGRARSIHPPTSPSRWLPSACSPCGACHRGSSWSSQRRAVGRSRRSAEGCTPIRDQTSQPNVSPGARGV